jgi:hypothetical protein
LLESTFAKSWMAWGFSFPSLRIWNTGTPRTRTASESRFRWQRQGNASAHSDSFSGQGIRQGIAAEPGPSPGTRIAADIREKADAVDLEQPEEGIQSLIRMPDGIQRARSRTFPHPFKNTYLGNVPENLLGEA